MTFGRLYSSVKQRFLKFTWNRRNNNIYVLMFHEVPKLMNETKNEINFSVSTEKFTNLLNTLSKKNISFSSVNDILSDEIDTSETKIVITFDDVYKSVVENAVPILNEFNIPFVLFISEKLVDQPGYISSEDILCLKNNPLCTIGFHSREHVPMNTLENKNQIEYAIDSKDFNEKYDLKCSYYAYPYGSVYTCPKRCIESISKSTYKAAFGTIHSGTSVKAIKKNQFYIPRLNVNENNVDYVIENIIKN